MKNRSALDVFSEIDQDKDDLIDPSELMSFIMNQGIKAKRDEVQSFLQHVDSNKDGKIDLIEFMNYISKEEKMSKMQFYKKYPKIDNNRNQENAELGPSAQ